MDWAGKAEALKALLGKSLLNKRAVEVLDKAESRVGIACSGGLDSVAALLLVHAHFPHLRSRLSVLHFNHLLRGNASDEDARFVERIAAGLALAFESASWSDRNSEKAASEASAREARQSFFDDFVAKDGRAIIVTGHQEGDILETLMLRIARSSNLTGLSAPKPVTVFPEGKTIVRPILDISRATLESAMTAAEVPWREDASNAESWFDRNRLRNEVIPVWQESTQFILGQAAARVRDYLEEADEVIDRFLAFSRYPPPSCNPAQLPIRLGPRGVLRRWLNLWLGEQGLAGCFQLTAFNEVLEILLKGGQRQWSAADGLLRVEGSVISFQPPVSESKPWSEPFWLEPGEAITLPSGAKLTSQWVTPSDSVLEDLRKGKYCENSTVLIDGDRIPGGSLQIRCRRPGDRYHAFNAPGTRKLQDMFVDRKISREERNNLPVVLTLDSLILWCPGLPVNHIGRVTLKTKKILQLTYTSLH